MSSDYAAREEDASEEDARQRALSIAADEEAAARGLDTDSPVPDAEIADARRSGRQHDHDDPAAYRRRTGARRPSAPGR